MKAPILFDRVNHNFCNYREEYEWSSYLDYLENNSSKLPRKKVMEMFDNMGNFIYMHNEKAEFTKINPCQGSKPWQGL